MSLLHALLVSAVVLETPALAQDPASDPPIAPDEMARQLFNNGKRLYDEGQYEQAIVAFEESLSLSGRNGLLYNIANAKERLGDLQGALDALNGYRIYANPDEQDVLLARVQAIQRRLDEQALVPPPAPNLDPLAITDTVPPLPAEPPRRSVAPWVVAGVGGALAVAGGALAAGTYSTGQGHLQAGDQAGWDQVRPLNNAAVGTAIGGAAVGIVGVVWGVAR